MRPTKAGLYTRNMRISYQLPFNCKQLPKANRVDSLKTTATSTKPTGKDSTIEMVRPNDPFWGHVEKMAGGLSRCMFCEYVFAAATSISRIKSHFAGVKRHGVNICTKVPKEIQEASYLAIHGSRKKLKTMPSEVANKFSTSSLEEKNEVEILARDIEEVLMESESSDEVESKSPAELIQFVETGSSVEGNVADAHETGGTALPVMDLVGQSIGKDWQEIYDSAKENDDLICSREDMAGDLIQEGLHETKGDALLTTAPVGQAFRRNCYILLPHHIHPPNKTQSEANQTKKERKKERKTNQPTNQDIKMSNATNPQSATEGQQSPRSEDQFDRQIGALSDAGKRGRDAKAGEQQQPEGKQAGKQEEGEEEEEEEGVKLESNPTPLLGRAREK